jgi:hypothetical protein
MAVDLRELDWVEVGPVPEVGGLLGSRTLQEDRGQTIQTVTSRKVEQGGEFTDI